MMAFAKVFGWASIVGAVLMFPLSSGAELLGAMRVNLVQGDVQVKIADTGEWVPASVNMPLVEGDELWVPEGSRAALQSTLGDYVRLDEGTALQILRMDHDSYQFHLSQGRAHVLNNAPTRSVLQFDTPDASIRSFGNSTFRVDIPEGETDVLVLRGTVTAESARGTTSVRAGSMLILGSDGYAELSPLPPPDGLADVEHATGPDRPRPGEKLRVPAGRTPGVLERLRGERPLGKCSGIRIRLDPDGRRDRRLGPVPAREVGVAGRRLRLGRL